MPTLCTSKLAPFVEYLDSITSRADLRVLERKLNELTIERADIEPVCCFGSKCYKRNIISKSEHYELLALCWRSGHVTPIHDHRGSSCAFKVVHGTGTEVRFARTESGVICPVATNTMKVGYVCAAEDEDIHQIGNMQREGLDLVTLHIYTPPIRKMRRYTYGHVGEPEEIPMMDGLPQTA